jgi:hypothetical protein
LTSYFKGKNSQKDRHVRKKFDKHEIDVLIPLTIFGALLLPLVSLLCGRVFPMEIYFRRIRKNNSKQTKTRRNELKRAISVETLESRHLMASVAMPVANDDSAYFTNMARPIKNVPLVLRDICIN